MKTLIKIEEAAITAVSIYFLSKYNLGLPVWVWVLLFFSPDISMLGYLFNTRIGAYTYNLVHHRATALTLAAIGLLTAANVLVAIGILLFAHSSFDRMMGYGLKYNDDFKHTHLGARCHPTLTIKYSQYTFWFSESLMRIFYNFGARFGNKLRMTFVLMIQPVCLWRKICCNLLMP